MISHLLQPQSRRWATSPTEGTDIPKTATATLGSAPATAAVPPLKADRLDSGQPLCGRGSRAAPKACKTATSLRDRETGKGGGRHK